VQVTLSKGDVDREITSSFVNGLHFDESAELGCRSPETLFPSEQQDA